MNLGNDHFTRVYNLEKHKSWIVSKIHRQSVMKIKIITVLKFINSKLITISVSIKIE